MFVPVSCRKVDVIREPRERASSFIHVLLIDQGTEAIFSQKDQVDDCDEEEGAREGLAKIRNERGRRRRSRRRRLGKTDKY